MQIHNYFAHLASFLKNNRCEEERKQKKKERQTQKEKKKERKKEIT
jgi:hypothetical protein